MFGHLDTAPKSFTFPRRNKRQHQKDQNKQSSANLSLPFLSNGLFRPVCRSNSLLPTSLERNYFRLLGCGSSQGVHVGVETETSTSDRPISQIGGATELVISGERDALLNKGAVYEVSTDTKGFYSRIFVVPQKWGKHRPVIDLRPLNRFVVYQHFKMESIQLVRDLLQREDWLTCIERTLILPCQSIRSIGSTSGLCGRAKPTSLDACPSGYRVPQGFSQSYSDL